MPSVLYEGMLAPIAPLSITGAIWYQGEQNSPRGYQYRKILPAMIADWRSLFGQGDFPFYIVSLPAFTKRSAVPVDGDDWTETRESQAIAAATVPNSCLAVTIDTGDPDNIHAKDKQPVGDRLALCALAKHYGKNVVYSGPDTGIRRASARIRFVCISRTPKAVSLSKATSSKNSPSPETTANGSGPTRASRATPLWSHRLPCPIPRRFATHGSRIPPPRSSMAPASRCAFPHRYLARQNRGSATVLNAFPQRLLRQPAFASWISRICIYVRICLQSRDLQNETLMALRVCRKLTISPEASCLNGAVRRRVL